MPVKVSKTVVSKELQKPSSKVKATYVKITGKKVSKVKAQLYLPKDTPHG